MSRHAAIQFLIYYKTAVIVALYFAGCLLLGFAFAAQWTPAPVPTNDAPGIWT